MQLTCCTVAYCPGRRRRKEEERKKRCKGQQGTTQWRQPLFLASSPCGSAACQARRSRCTMPGTQWEWEWRRGSQQSLARRPCRDGRTVPYARQTSPDGYVRRPGNTPWAVRVSGAPVAVQGCFESCPYAANRPSADTTVPILSNPAPGGGLGSASEALAACVPAGTRRFVSPSSRVLRCAVPRVRCVAVDSARPLTIRGPEARGGEGGKSLC
jgi:hypothetical protein